MGHRDGDIKIVWRSWTYLMGEVIPSCHQYMVHINLIETCYHAEICVWYHTEFLWSEWDEWENWSWWDITVPNLISIWLYGTPLGVKCERFYTEEMFFCDSIKKIKKIKIGGLGFRNFNVYWCVLMLVLVIEPKFSVLKILKSTGPREGGGRIGESPWMRIVHRLDYPIYPKRLADIAI